VRQILVTRLVESTYYASIVVDLNGRQIELDSRPSDAIALAVRVDAPIFVDEKVLDEAGFEPDQEEVDGEDDESEREPIPDEKLKVFKEFIDQLDLDDFGRS
jgi:bifunctional DNase/RNase